MLHACKACRNGENAHQQPLTDSIKILRLTQPFRRKVQHQQRHAVPACAVAIIGRQMWRHYDAYPTVDKSLRVCSHGCAASTA